MSELIDTTQMYLRTVVELEEEGVVARRARIAERLEQSSPTVSQTAARMERDGLLTLTDDRVIELTPAGRAEGIRVMRRHRLAECLLVDTLGLSLDMVHDEACRWEHVLSDLVEERIAHLLDEPTVSPYGNPIPGLDQLGLPAARESFLDGCWSIEDALRAGIETGQVARMSENIQRDRQILAAVVDAGIVPGAQVSFSDDGHTGHITGPRGEVDLPSSIAASLFVRRDA